MSKSILRMIHSALLLSQRVFRKNPRTCAALTLIALIVSLIPLKQLNMVLFMNEMMDKDFSSYQELIDLEDQFIEQNSLTLILRPKDDKQTFSKEDICKLRTWLSRTDFPTRELVSSLGVRRIQWSEKGYQFRTLMEPDCSHNLKNPGLIQEGLNAIQDSPWGLALSSISKQELTFNFFLQNCINCEDSEVFDVKTAEIFKQQVDESILKNLPQLESIWTGIAEYQLQLKKAYDINGLMSLLSIAIIFLFFRWAFGSIQVSLLFVFCYLIGLIPVFSIMALLGWPIDVLTSSIAIIVLIASLEDFIFVCYQMADQKTKLLKSLRVLLLPGFFTSVTTIVGFGSLAVSDLAIIRRFGITAALGSLFEFISIFFILPMLLRLFPQLSPQLKGPPLWFNRASVFLQSFRLRARVSWATLAGFILLLGFAMQGTLPLVVSDTPENIFPESHELRKNTKKLLDSRGWKSDFSLVYNSKDQAQIMKVVEEISSDPIVKGIESPWQIHDFLTKNQTPEQKELSLLNWERASLSRRLENSDTGKSRVIFYINSTDIVDIRRVQKMAQSLCEGQDCYLAGILVSYGEFGDRVLSTLVESLGVSLLIVGGILIFLMRALQQPNMIAILVSSLWGPMALLAVFICARLPLFYVTSIIASILVGLAGDNAIQYIFSNHRMKNDKGPEKFIGASLMVTMAMILISLGLLFSPFGPMRTLAVLFTLGFLLCLAGDYWVLKSLQKKSVASNSLS